MNRMLFLLVLLVVSLLAAVAAANWPPTVYNVRAVQRAGTNLVDIEYDLGDPEGDTVTVSVYLSTDGGLTWPLHCVTISGDVGGGVTSGFGRTIVWDAGADYPGYNGEDCRIRVLADDGGAADDGFVLISGGVFLMGGNGCDNATEHYVDVGSFYLSEIEVTQAQYAALNPEYEVSYPNRPAASVSWYDAVAYCNALSVQEGYTPAYAINGTSVTWNPAADGFRLPTESEWEYACRANSLTNYCNGDWESDLAQVGWYEGDSDGHAHDVRTRYANQWGLYDMHGNVWEWCWDIYCYNYPAGTLENPHVDYGSGGSSCTSWRVNRGGAFNYGANGCRSAFRGGSNPSSASHPFGIRLARSAN